MHPGGERDSVGVHCNVAQNSVQVFVLEAVVSFGQAMPYNPWSRLTSDPKTRNTFEMADPRAKSEHVWPEMFSQVWAHRTTHDTHTNTRTRRTTACTTTQSHTQTHTHTHTLAHALTHSHAHTTPAKTRNGGFGSLAIHQSGVSTFSGRLGCGWSLEIMSLPILATMCVQRWCFGE